MAGFRDEAPDLAAKLKDGAVVLEIAPGLGYLTIEMAKRGPSRIAGVDISKTFVEIAGANAKRAASISISGKAMRPTCPSRPTGSISSSAARRSRISAIPLARCAKCIACCGRAARR